MYALMGFVAAVEGSEDISCTLRYSMEIRIGIGVDAILH
jgi:hypothetical protein